VKLIAKVKLVTDADSAEALKSTMRVANSACDWISDYAWRSKVFGQYALHKLVYRQVREKFDLTAQIVVRCIAKVADSYKLDKKSKRSFRPTGSIAYDDRILKWHVAKGAVNLWTTKGRLTLPFRAGERQLRLLQNRQGESDLILQCGMFYLAAVCNVDAPEPSDVDDFLGVDFGVVQIATDSDGQTYSGKAVNNVRYRHRKLRASLQHRQTRSAKRRLKKLAGRETRFAKNVNHCISKQIVADAQRTGRGVAIEDLKGIRERIRARREQRAVLHSWSFSQLGLFVAYKAALAGIPLVFVDPRNTSRECSVCGHIAKQNRPSQSVFRCVSCGHEANADFNAALVIRSRAVVNRPIVARVVLSSEHLSGGFQPQLQATGF
jgi:putative transposase